MKHIKILSLIFFALVVLSNPTSTFAKESIKSTRVIYVKNGGVVKNKNWNNGISFVVKPYSNKEIFNKAVALASDHFSEFNVVLTTDYKVFSAFDPFHRTTIIVGSTSILGPYTGYSWNSSYLWGDDTPGFVLTNNCNPKEMLSDINNVIAHESGHMFGLDDELNNSIMGNFAGEGYANWTSDDVAKLASNIGLKLNVDKSLLAYN